MIDIELQGAVKVPSFVQFVPIVLGMDFAVLLSFKSIIKGLFVDTSLLHNLLRFVKVYSYLLSKKTMASLPRGHFLLYFCLICLRLSLLGGASSSKIVLAVDLSR